MLCRSAWLPKSILNFRIGSVSSIGGSIAATLFADTVSDSQTDGLLLHQHNYTEELLREHSSHITARKRMTSGEPDHFRNEDSLPPNPSNPEHQEWIKRCQRILGGLQWLSTRTRPDLVLPSPRQPKS